MAETTQVRYCEPMRKIILASKSERRAEILKLGGIEFDIEESGYEENLQEKVPPEELAEKIALGKVLAVVPRHSDAIIIGADTFIVLEEKIFGKPITEFRAQEMLESLSGKMHVVLTGFAVVDTKNGACESGVAETKVYFRKLASKEIEDYVKHGKPSPLNLAGAYAIQAGAASFVTRIEGDFFATMGLPISKIFQILKKFGAMSN